MTLTSENTTVVVTVTYGNRWHLLHQTLTAVFNEGIRSAIVVDNGSQDSIIENAIKEFGGKVHVVTLPTNTGSANGYKIGVEEALKTDANYFWLLDDDNKPLHGSLNNLLLANQFLGLNEQCALLSLRRDRLEYVSAAKSGRAGFFINNSFMGFHFKDAFLKIADQLLGQKTPSDSFRFPLVSIDYAPYGGFFFHRNWVNIIGLPDENYFLYGDDHEYTSRIISHGGSIYLCSNSEVLDLETSWHLQRQKLPSFFSTSGSDDKVFYSIRNRVYFEKERLISNHFIYSINKIFFISFQTIKSLFRGASIRHTFTRLCLIRRAIIKGNAGQLGRIN